MNDQQKKAVEEAVKRRTISSLSRTGFRLGAEEVISNPEKYGLIPYHIHANLRNKYTSVLAFYDKHVGTPCEEIRHRVEVEELKEENARLRAALEYLMEGVKELPPLTAIAVTLVDHYNKAEEALKGGDTCKP